jgi:quinol-cytochrome oxidoreductase complex cytochrome b subunit
MTTATPKATRKGLGATIEDQFALTQLIREYLIPAETNNLWYTLGGVLAIALVLEVATGFILTIVYVPDAGRAYDITKTLLSDGLWAVLLNFHFWTAYVIFALVMLHLMRVFLTGAYRGTKVGLWLGGVILAACVFLAFITGESLHWDEVGFAVPWHISEFFQAIGLATAVNYTFAQLRDIGGATERLGQIYALHISIAPLLILLFVTLHYYLIKVKGISIPFWLKESGRKLAFSTHIAEWLKYSVLILGAVLLLSIFVQRDPGIAPQLIPSSPLFGSPHGPGGNGAKPTFPIGWTHGMNVFFGQFLHIDPDIWGTVVGMVIIAGALLAVPFLDRGTRAPQGWREAFDWRKRGWAFFVVALMWFTMILGFLVNFLAVPD